MTFPKFAYVGCFTGGKGGGHGEGIGVYRIDPASGAWKLIEIVSTLPSPGFLVLDRQGKFLYSAHGLGSEVSAYAIDRETGRLSLLNRQPTGGKNGLHLDVHPNNRLLALARGPGIAIFPIYPDGCLGAFVDSNDFAGTRHHMVLFDPSGRYLLAADHGNHRLHVFPFDPASGKLIKERHFAIERPNAAPRHLAFHPGQPWVYDVNGNGTVTGYRWDDDKGRLVPFQTVRTVPHSYTAKNGASEIAIPPSGKFVYVANRPHDTIGIFSVDQETGELNAIGWEPIQGEHPRFFTLDATGRHLYAAALHSDRIVVFSANGDTGQLAPTGQVIETPSPTCIAFAY